MGARETARKWTRPYTSVQWAWVRALCVEPSAKWTDGETRKQRRRRRRDVRELMGQRFGVRGL